MPLQDISSQESAFTAQRFPFLERAVARYGRMAVSLEEYCARPPQPLRPLVVNNLVTLSADELDALRDEYASGYGVLHVVPQIFPDHTNFDEHHPLLLFARQVAEVLPLGYPVDHPMESHPEARARFGPPDGTLKLYNLPIPPGQDRYREQAETTELFAAHNDGLGYAGLIRSSIIALDRAPLWGGYTYFQNLVRFATVLSESDPDAFEALFLPDAITALRPRGKGAIKVTAPVFFLGLDSEPQMFFRVASGEYVITWRSHPALLRAQKILERLCVPFGADSRFVHLVRPGELVLIDNRHVAHGRTRFIDPDDGSGRILARKWFVPTLSDAIYRHVPGMAVYPKYARLFPEQFSGATLTGEWNFDAGVSNNIRNKVGLCQFTQVCNYTHLIVTVVIGEPGLHYLCNLLTVWRIACV